MNKSIFVLLIFILTLFTVGLAVALTMRLVRIAG